MDIYVWVCVFVDRWPKRESISSIFEVALECLEDLPLSILA